MKSKEKFSRIILAFLKDNKNKKFTVKEIGESCFCGQGMEYHHNVSEFLTWLNEMGYVRWFFNGVETRRKDIKEKVIGGLYQYKCGDGISTNDKILDLWRKDTLDFFKDNPQNAFTTTQLARAICGGDLEFINTQTIVMRELEKDGKVIFYHMGKKTFRGNSDKNGKWVSSRYCITFR